MATYSIQCAKCGLFIRYADYEPSSGEFCDDCRQGLADARKEQEDRTAEAEKELDRIRRRYSGD